MAEPDPELTRLYLARQQQLATAGGLAVARAWDELGSLDDTDIERLRRAAGPGVEVFSQQAGAAAAAYLAATLGGAPVAAVTVAEPDWLGPFTWAWRALGNGADLPEAIESGRSRAIAAGHKAVTSTARRTGDLLGGRVAGWRRSLAGASCDWCIQVAGQTYESAASADFGHDHCNCGVVPILR